MTINFYLNNNPKSSNNPEQIIFCYVREKGKTLTLHTGERINPKFWNGAKQEAKKNYSGSSELNTYINSYKEEIKKTNRLFLIENPLATFEELKELLIAKFKKEELKTGFFDVFAMFLELRSTTLSDSMIKKYKVLRNHLKTFEIETKYSITFKSIDKLFIDKFTNFCLNEKKHCNNTVTKNITLLKTFLNWAADRNINTNNDYKKFKISYNKTELIALSEKELMLLYELDLIKNPALEKTRDVFVFQCFTGQRFSDISNINRDDIKNDIWHLRTVKTKDILKIPLNKYAIEILNKYLSSNKPLPIISQQKTNIHIKELCKLASIDEPITMVKYSGKDRIAETFKKYELVSTHTARRTFATLSLEKGMRIEVIMKITGHTDRKTFDKYVKVTETVTKLELEKAWNDEPKLKIVNL